MSEFKILVDVELNTSGIQEKLNSAAKGVKIKIDDVSISENALAGIKKDIKKSIESGAAMASLGFDVDKKDIAKQTKAGIVAGVRAAEKDKSVSTMLIGGKQGLSDTRRIGVSPKRTGSTYGIKEMGGYVPSNEWTKTVFVRDKPDDKKREHDRARDRVLNEMYMPRESGRFGFDKSMSLQSNMRNLEGIWRSYLGSQVRLSKMNPKTDPVAHREELKYQRGLRHEVHRMLKNLRNGDFYEDDGHTLRETRELTPMERAHFQQMGKYSLRDMDMGQARSIDTFNKNLVKLDYEDFMSTLKRINSMEVKLPFLDQFSQEAKTARRVLDDLYLHADQLKESSWDKFNYRQKAKIAAQLGKSQEKLDLANSRSDDKDTEKAFARRKQLQKKIAAARKDMVGLEEGSSAKRQKELDVAAMKKEVAELDSLHKWNNKQIVEMRTIARDTQMAMSDSTAKKQDKELNEAYKERLRIAGEIGKKKKALVGLDSKSEQAKQLNSDVEELEVAKKRIDSENKFRKEQILGIEAVERKQAQLVSQEENKVYDKLVSDDEKAKLKEIENDIGSLKEATRELANTKVRMVGLDEASNEFAELSSNAKSAEANIESLKRKLNGRWNGDQKADYDEYARKQSGKIDVKYASKQDEEHKRLVGELIGLEKQLGDARVERAKKQGTYDSDFAHKEVSRLKTEMKPLMDKLGITEFDDRGSLRDDEYIKLIKTREEALRSQNKAEKNYIVEQERRDQKFIRRREALLQNLELYEQRNTKALKGKGNAEFAEEFKNIKKAAQNVDSIHIDGLEDEFSKFKKNVEIAGKSGYTTIDKLKNKFKEYSTYAIASFGVMEVAQGFGAMARQVLEVDTAMTGLQRVTDMTSESYDKLYEKMSKSSREYGRTLTDTINATADWVRAGFDAETALGLAEKTAMYQNVSDLDYKEAAKNMLTSYNGFKDTLMQEFNNDAVEANGHIVDVLNELDKLSCPQGTISVKGQRWLRPSKDYNIIKQIYGDIFKWKTKLKNTKLKIRGCQNIYIRLDLTGSIAVNAA